MPQPDPCRAHIHLILDTSTSPPGCRGVRITIDDRPAPAMSGQVLLRLLTAEAPTVDGALVALGARVTGGGKGMHWIWRMLHPADLAQLRIRSKCPERPRRDEK